MRKLIFLFAFIVFFMGRPLAISANSNTTVDTLITEQFNYDAALDEETIRQDLEKNIDSKYELVDIDIQPIEIAPKEIQIQKEMIVTNAKMALEQFPDVELYDENGYAGELFRVDDSLKLEERETSDETVTSKKTMQKIYKYLPDNDVSNIPKDINENGVSMSLEDLDFVVASYKAIGSSTIPNTYNGIATYGYSVSSQSKKAVDYLAKITYSNTLLKHTENRVIVTLKEKLPSQTPPTQTITSVVDPDQDIDALQIVPDNTLVTAPTPLGKSIAINNLDKDAGNINIKEENVSSSSSIGNTLSMILLSALFLCATCIGIGYMYYILKNNITVMNNDAGTYKYIGRAKIIEQNHNETPRLMLDLTPFQDKLYSTVFQVEIPKGVVQNLNDKIVNISLVMHNKRYIRQITLNFDKDKKDFKYSVGF